MADPVAWYDANVETVSERYEVSTAEDVHGWLLDLLPAIPATILDVGAVSGRDAVWLAARGYDVIAAEPSANMRAAAARLHPAARVYWIDDTPPAESSDNKITHGQGQQTPGEAIRPWCIDHYAG